MNTTTLRAYTETPRTKRIVVTARESDRIVAALRHTTARVFDIARDHGLEVSTINKIAVANEIDVRGRE